MPEIMTFGKVFVMDGKEHIYLARFEEITYVAEILDNHLSKWVKKKRDRIFKNTNLTHKSYQNKMYCFIELRTDQFVERVAHYGRPPVEDDPQNGFLAEEIIGELCKEDMKELHNEITKNDIAVDRQLKELISKISI